MDASYKVEELARAGGTSVRTVRYYVQRGLLPGPTFKGKDSTWGPEHLVRLRAIRRMQDAFFPLDAIVVELGRRTLTEIARIAEGELPEQAGVVEGAGRGTKKGQIERPRPSSSALTGVEGERVFRRIEVAPGVELSVALDAPAESLALVDALVATIVDRLREQGPT